MRIIWCIIIEMILETKDSHFICMPACLWAGANTKTNKTVYNLEAWKFAYNHIEPHGTNEQGQCGVLNAVYFTKYVCSESAHFFYFYYKKW